MGLAGYVAGYVALINIEPQWWLAAIFVAVGSAVGELGVPIVRSFIGEANVFSSRLYTIVPLVAFAAAVASPLLVPVSRWCLRMGKTEWKAPAE